VATPDVSFPDAYRQSARRSRARREAAARRRRLLRGGRGGLATLVGALALAAGVAVAQEPAPAPESGDAPAEAIEPGDEGKDVKALQRALKIRPDGEYGRKTKRAVRRFQRKEGLKADGVAGPETLQALGIAPAGEEDAPTSGDSGGVGSDDHLAQIRECESGGDYTANTGNGFYGAYQFTKESWEQMGGTGMPHEAPPEEQDRLAKKLMEEQGPEAWPNCA
jgi:peptidoglycan hydrolase-like protein with peptidoglycan-binding domain